MERTELPMYITVAGLIVTFLSFIIYIFQPFEIFVLVFVIGLVMMIGGYIILNSTDRDMANLLIDLNQKKADLKGEIICLCGQYVPEAECGSIESLEDYRWQRSTPISSTCSSIRPICTGGTTI